jgi:hypothetical protein
LLGPSNPSNNACINLFSSLLDVALQGNPNQNELKETKATGKVNPFLSSPCGVFFRRATENVLTVFSFLAVYY